jgi:hypothetical protein
MTCELCGAAVTSFDGGYVCPECCTVVLDESEGGVTGWNVYDERVIE